MLILHFIGLAMGLGTSFAMLFLGIAGSKLEPAKGREFMLNATAVLRMGQIGIVVLLITGLYLMTPYWASLGEQPLLITKLILFIVLSGLLGVLSSKARKARKGDAETHMKAMVPLGRLILLTALGIVVLAVMVFR
ncbi:MAG: hypothetical protein IPP83_01120 [Flavobacteriales bacterium]|nr:hypothetical protein [Flavobacteriales bacterium]